MKDIKKSQRFFSEFFLEILKNFIDDFFIQFYDYQRHFYVVTKPEYLLKVLSFFFHNSQMQFKSIIEIICVDFPQNDKRFEVIYQFLSVKYSVRLFVKVCVSEIESIESITSLYKGAGWFEREVYDLFGIFFYNHSDLRRILTDYGFEGFPLRKDFPLSGYLEIAYDESNKQVESSLLELTQDFRFFLFLNPWENNVK